MTHFILFEAPQARRTAHSDRHERAHGGGHSELNTGDQGRHWTLLCVCVFFVFLKGRSWRKAVPSLFVCSMMFYEKVREALFLILCTRV